MFLTVCNLILSPHPLGRSILDEARDQPIPGSFLKTLGTRLLFTRVRILLNHDPVTYFTTSKSLHYITLQRGDQLFTRVRILLNHDPVTYFTTSKSFHYIAAGRPTLHMSSYSAESWSRDLFHNIKIIPLHCSGETNSSHEFVFC